MSQFNRHQSGQAVSTSQASNRRWSTWRHLPIIQFLLLLGVVFALTILPLPTWARLLWPNWIALFVLAACLKQEHWFGVIGAFGVGLLQDVMTGSLLGVHALPLVLLAYVVLRLQRQFYIFSLGQQTGIVLVLLFVHHLLLILLYKLLGGVAITAGVWLTPISTTACWLLIWPSLI